MTSDQREIAEAIFERNQRREKEINDYVSHRLILQGIQEVRTEDRAQQN
jgi:hypothetical protein